MSKRAVLYARVAYSEPGDDGSKLAGQIAACGEYARARGYVIVAAIPEDAQSSSGLRLDRPGLTQVRAMAHAGEFDVLVVYGIDRLARSLTKYLLLENELRQAGIGIECVWGECTAILASSLLQSLLRTAESAAPHHPVRIRRCRRDSLIPRA
jgi:DNA invertase Pin-like site-specific DNA recombinase